METEKRKICRPDSPEDGPKDGVQMKADCIRTDFIENPEEGEALFQQREKSNSHISASVEIGILSIRDMQSGVMLTVSFQDVMEVMAAALDVAKEEGKCMGKISVNAEAADNA